jgi:2-iminobutanoate/2-iminopropanoate deaminase
MPRQSINASFLHSNPIPSASRIGPLLVSSVISGRPADSDVMPDDPEEQFENCFIHIGEMLKAAGGDWRHVARITFMVPSGAYRAACNPPWLKRFPDPESRPARHNMVIPGVSGVTCEFIAYIDD